MATQSSPMKNMEEKCPPDTYFYLCQQFIHYNIKDKHLQKILIDQLKNYVFDFPQDLEFLYCMWIKAYPIDETDIFEIKSPTKKSRRHRNEMDSQISTETERPKEQVQFWKPSST